MTWEPTHVQFTVLRARKLVGKAKGSKASKVGDVFVSIQSGKEKFQTTTIKYGANTQNSVEWFEQCDLSIPHMEAEVEVTLMNRGLLSDEFIGYAAVPLNQFSVYDRPRSEWFQLKQKPSKPPDGRYRGEIEVRLTFHVKSRSEEQADSKLKESRAPSLKSLVTAVGKVGDKFKFTRSRSLRGEGRRDFSPNLSRSPASDKKLKQRSPNHVTDDNASSNAAVNFPAVDLYAPDWNENDCDTDSLGDGNFARSYSMDVNQRKQYKDFKSQSMFNLPSEKSMTLPTRRKHKRPSLDDTFLDGSSPRNNRGSVTSQEGYLENMFQKECEVYNDMAEEYDECIEEEPEFESRNMRTAHVYRDNIEDQGSSRSLTSSDSRDSSDSESDREIMLPKVKHKEVEGSSSPAEQYQADDERPETPEMADISEEFASSSPQNTQTFSQNTVESVPHLPRQNGRLNSQGSSEYIPSSRGSSSKSSYSQEGRYRKGGSSDSLSKSKRLISPDTEFSFTGLSHFSADSETSQRRRSKSQYTKGGRRFTIQGLQDFNRRSTPDFRSFRPVQGRDDSVPEDLMTVYRNMTREELIRLVVTHKAQLIRKDQYIRDLENYIDSLLVRVMEQTPRILQNL